MAKKERKRKKKKEKSCVFVFKGDKLFFFDIWLLCDFAHFYYLCVFFK